jgi:hypothetical protein
LQKFLRRKPRYTPYYGCIEDYYEEFKRTYDRKFNKKYGYLRSHIEKVIYQYLDCGILHNGFARIQCGSCGHESLLAFSCKRRHFCSYCHAKRVIEFGEWLCGNILKKGLITEGTIQLISSWRHTGFSTYCGKRIYPKDKISTENLARHIIRASFSQESMEYYPERPMVTYESKYGKKVAEFDPLEWMAALVSNIPDRGAQPVHYYGQYSNATRGRLKKEGSQPQCYNIDDDSPKTLSRSWARPIQKIYEVDPPTCPICQGKIRIIAFIEDYKVVKRSLIIWI